MKTKQSIINSALAGVLALGFASNTLAAEPKQGEKCYGVAKAAKNDCQTATSSCAGSSKEDSDPSAFIYLPKGTCEKIVGASLTAKG